MKKSSCFFRKLNRITSSCGTFNCHALKISRALCEANQALPKKRGCRGEECYDKRHRRKYSSSPGKYR